MEKSTAIVRSATNSALHGLAPGVERMMTVFVNLYFIQSDDGSWFLIDTGLPMQASRVRAWAEARFGPTSGPQRSS